MSSPAPASSGFGGSAPDIPMTKPKAPGNPTNRICSTTTATSLTNVFNCTPPCCCCCCVSCRLLELCLYNVSIVRVVRMISSNVDIGRMANVAAYKLPTAFRNVPCSLLPRTGPHFPSLTSQYMMFNVNMKRTLKATEPKTDLIIRFGDSQTAALSGNQTATNRSTLIKTTNVSVLVVADCHMAV